MLPGAWTEPSQTGSHQGTKKRGSPKMDSTEQSTKDWINQHQINGWLSTEDKQRCLQEGRCFRCLEIGHRSIDCPTLRERRCASCQQMGHCARECPFENNQTSNQWFKGTGQTKSISQPIQIQTQGSHRPDLGALPMDQLRQRMLKTDSPLCAPESDHARGRARPSVTQEKQRCANCQKTRCKIQDCPIRSLTTSTTPQEEERRAKENLANIIRNIKAMPIEDRLGMIADAWGEESLTPAKIQIRQVGTIKPTTKEQANKHFRQFNVTEQKEMALQILKEFPEERLAPKYLKLLKRQETAKSVQIHTLQITKQKEPPTKRIQVLKTKPVSKEQAKKRLQHCKEQNEIALEFLDEIPNDRLTPKQRRLQQKLRQSAKPVVMGNLSVAKNTPEA